MSTLLSERRVSDAELKAWLDSTDGRHEGTLMLAFAADLRREASSRRSADQWIAEHHWSGTGYLLNEYEMVGGDWPDGVTPKWAHPCVECRGNVHHGHRDDCSVPSLTTETPE